MADQIRMDSHKLIYHPETVAKWMAGEEIYPIEIEMAPSGACNHRCTFCAVDYLGYKPNFLDKDIVLRDVRYAHQHGLKSVIYAGEGEPLLNRQLPEMALGMKAAGVDVAMSSNGVLFTKELAGECLEAFTWIRFSVASLEEKSYYSIQRAPKGDLDKVKKNLADAVEVKNSKGLHTTLGVQCLLLQDNMKQLPRMAVELRRMGVDYFTIKPFSQHLHSSNQYQIDYEQMLGIEAELKQYETPDFSIYFRANAMKRVHHEKSYSKCLGLPFMTYIDAKGNVWSCVAHIGSNEFCYGNINEKSFAEIWEGKRRREVMKRLWSLDINKACREACRLDVINQYLHELKHPGEHVNFI